MVYFGAAIGFSLTLYFSGLLYTIIAAQKVFSHHERNNIITLTVRQILISFISIGIFFFINVNNYSLSVVEPLKLSNVLDVAFSLVINFTLCMLSIFMGFILIYGNKFIKKIRQIVRSSYITLRASH